MGFVHRKLKQHGYNDDSLSKLERWDKIDLLRDIANKQLAESGRVDPELEKFARDVRMTTKMQKQKYQNDINKQLVVLIDNLRKQESTHIESDDEMDLIADFEELIVREKKELEKYRNLMNDEDDPSNIGSDGGSISGMHSQLAENDIDFGDPND